PVRADPSRDVAVAVVCTGPCDGIASSVVWLVREYGMKASELFDLTARVALITGASSGLGAHFAQTLAENGAKVVLVARRAERLETLKKKIEAAGGQAIAVEADVLDRAAMAR